MEWHQSMLTSVVAVMNKSFATSTKITSPEGMEL